MSKNTLVKPLANYPHARHAGNILELSGTGPRDKATNTVPGIVRGEKGEVIGHDITAEFNQCVKNVEDVLKEHGLTLKDLTKVLVYMTNREDIPALNKAWNKTFPDPEEAPTRAICGVVFLPKGGDADIHVELVCTAYIPEEP